MILPHDCVKMIHHVANMPRKSSIKETNMPLVVGISFKKVGKVYYFDPAGIELQEGDPVIAETARGVEFGEVMTEPKEVPDEEIVSPLKKIVRKATPADMEREESNRHKEKNAFTTCQQKIQSHNLPMKLINAEYGFDGSQVTFYFSAEARVDFRELVKDLAGALRTKVQLHQVGVRDEAKLFGGMGPCGRKLCCSSFLNGFEPVSMKMAKEQSLFLNPLKFSGICGKLMCCLKYEYPIYKEVKSRLPAMGSIVMTQKGSGKVVEINVIKETLSVELQDGLVLHCTAEDLVQQSPQCPMAEVACNGCGAEEAVKAEETDEAEETGETSETQPQPEPEPEPAPQPESAPQPQPAPQDQPASGGQGDSAPGNGKRRRRRRRNRK